MPFCVTANPQQFALFWRRRWIFKRIEIRYYNKPLLFNIGPEESLLVNKRLEKDDDSVTLLICATQRILYHPFPIPAPENIQFQPFVHGVIRIMHDCNNLDISWKRRFLTIIEQLHLVDNQPYVMLTDDFKYPLHIIVISYKILGGYTMVILTTGTFDRQEDYIIAVEHEVLGKGF